jgi:hypothetical protein
LIIYRIAAVLPYKKGEKMLELFTSYVLPFLAGVAVVGALALRIHWRGGPAGLFVVFFIILFGPSLAYALIADESSGTLFMLSMLAALAATGILWLKLYRGKKN